MCESVKITVLVTVEKYYVLLTTTFTWGFPQSFLYISHFSAGGITLLCPAVVKAGYCFSGDQQKHTGSHWETWEYAGILTTAVRI